MKGSKKPSRTKRVGSRPSSQAALISRAALVKKRRADFGEAKTPSALAACRVAQTIQPTPISSGVPTCRFVSTRHASPIGPSRGARSVAKVGLAAQAWLQCLHRDRSVRLRLGRFDPKQAVVERLKNRRGHFRARKGTENEVIRRIDRDDEQDGDRARERDQWHAAPPVFEQKKAAPDRHEDDDENAFFARVPENGDHDAGGEGNPPVARDQTRSKPPRVNQRSAQ